MKKLIAATLVVGSSMLAPSLLATDQGAQYHIGYSKMDMRSLSGNGGVFGMNYIFPLSVLGDGEHDGVEVGFGFDFGGGSLKLDNGGSDQYGNADVRVSTGYHYGSFNVRAFLGYGYVTIGSSSNAMDGMLYGVSSGFDFTKSFGVEAVYKKSSMSPVVGPNTDVSFAGLNLVWKK